MSGNKRHMLEDLTKNVNLDSKSEGSENNDSTDFQDAMGSANESSPDSPGSESCYEDLVNDEESQLSEEETEERRKRVLEIKENGNELFRNGFYDEASLLYSEALKLCPFSLKEEKSMLYNNRAASRAKQGHREDALKDCTKAVELNPEYFKALLRRAKLYEDLDQLDKALADYQELSRLEPNNHEVKSALGTLPRRIEEQTEKLKQEMFGKMKDLGNMFLKPFGLSTDNFQINQDPVTGSYSVNMSK